MIIETTNRVKLSIKLEALDLSLQPVPSQIWHSFLSSQILGSTSARHPLATSAKNKLLIFLLNVGILELTCFGVYSGYVNITLLLFCVLVA